MTWLPLVLGPLLAQLTPAPAATPSPVPTGPIYVGNPATHFRLESRPLGFDPDGNARWLVVVRYLDAQNQPTKIMLNSDLDYQEDRGLMQWQPRMRFGQPSAIVTTTQPGLLTLTVTSNTPFKGKQVARTDPAAWHFARVVAAPLGPHLIQIGWFPREMNDVRIVRADARGKRTAIAIVAAPSSTYRDASVKSSSVYRYEIYRGEKAAVRTPWVRTDAELARTSVSSASGKGIWLYFGTNPYDDHFIMTLDPAQIADQAARGGLHYVELRTAYGGYWEVEPAIKARVDAIIDALADRGIGTIGWSVPRQASYEDLRQSVRTAEYRTARGTRFTALALDLERGDEFMHDCPEGCIAMSQYVQVLRAALGAKYTIVSTVEDPYLENLDNAKYPYRAIAQYSDVLQPMTYWRMLSKNSASIDKMKALLAASYQKTLQVAGRSLPISIGGQTSSEGVRGSPPPGEVYGSLEQSKVLGAIGECFFDWDGTSADQWNAIARFSW